MKNIRINNIECRKCDTPFYEIINWFPNPYYGKEDDYIKDGYEWNDDKTCLIKDCYHIHESNFKNEESCCVIAWIKLSDDGTVTLESVDDRILNLEPEELKDFIEVYRISNDKLKQKHHLIDLMNSENDDAVTMTNGVEIDVVAEVNTDYGKFVITVDDNCYLILKRLENSEYEPKYHIEKEFHNALKELPSLGEKTYENKHLDINPYSTKISKRSLWKRKN